MVLAIALTAALAGAVGAPAPAHAKGEFPEKRWITGQAVNLRERPALDAAILTRMPLNTAVDLLETPPDGMFCKVAVTGKDNVVQRGYTGCRYLGAKMLQLEKIDDPLLNDGAPNPNFDPQKGFWLAPSYEALKIYGEYLEEGTLTAEQRADQSYSRPPVAEFDKMKAHLAKGIFGPAAAPYPLWEEVKQLADIVEKKRRLIFSDKDMPQDALKSNFINASYSQITRLQEQVGAFDIGEMKIAALVAAIELPIIGSSLFQRADEVAAPREEAEQISGRFHLIHRIQTKGRKHGRGDSQIIIAGTWDVGQVDVSLTKAVSKNILFRDGALKASPSHVQRTFFEWSEADAPMCEDYAGDGYSFGDSNPKIWSGYGFEKSAYAESLQRNPKNSLMFFYTPAPLTQQSAKLSVNTQKMDKKSTGFASSVSFFVDLNDDGIVDLAVWEGTGRALGHLDGVPKTDDAYQRIFFVNIAGRWHVLGHDRFSYGCGC